MAYKFHYIKLIDDTTILNRIRLMVAEFIGTFILVFIGCMCCVFTVIPEPIQVAAIAMGFGFAVAMSVTTFAHISGSHINPAVSLAAVILGYMPLINLPLYWIAQVLGSITGYGFLMLVAGDMHPANTTAFCVNHVNPYIQQVQGFGIEFGATMILVFTVCGVWDYRNRERHDSVPIKFGVIITGLAVATIPFTSAGLNPARSFGPALLTLDFEDLWVFVAGPFCGGIFASILYRFVFEYKPILEELD